MAEYTSKALIIGNSSALLKAVGCINLKFPVLYNFPAG